MALLCEIPEWEIICRIYSMASASRTLLALPKLHCTSQSLAGCFSNKYSHIGLAESEFPGLGPGHLHLQQATPGDYCVLG